MTDNEIIKALECCAGEDRPCKECTYSTVPFPVCKELTARKALDLINRQKAEIERLKNNLHRLETMSKYER